MALYHKHRPQTFASIIGQEHIVTTIKNQVRHATVAHAYLLSGPRGVGKTTTARVLAKAVNCTGRAPDDYEPCNSCVSCQEIAASRAIDVIEIDAASHTGVDHVRENIIDNAQFKPTKSPYKIFIIDEVHMLSTSAFNALLKTLEEPPAHVLFILATTEKHKLPDTIVSRCQRFDFKKVGYDVMKQHITDVAKEERVTIETEVIDRLISKSDGCVRDAVSLLDQLMATGAKKITAEVATILLPTSQADETLHFVRALMHKDAAAGLTQLQSLSSDGINLPQFAHDTVELLRVMLIIKVHTDTKAIGLDITDKTKKELRLLAETIPSYALIQLIDLLLRRRAEIKSAPIPELPLELAVIEWCEAGDTPPAEPKSQINAPAPKQVLPGESKPTISERVRHIVHGKDAAVTVDEVKICWGACLEELEKMSPSLAFILKMAKITGVNGSTIILNVEYSFHKDTLINNKETKRKIEQLLTSRLQTPVDVEVQVEAKKDPREHTDELQRLTAAFGGEVVTL